MVHAHAGQNLLKFDNLNPSFKNLFGVAEGLGTPHHQDRPPCKPNPADNFQPSPPGLERMMVREGPDDFFYALCKDNCLIPLTEASRSHQMTDFSHH